MRGLKVGFGLVILSGSFTSAGGLPANANGYDARLQEFGIDPRCADADFYDHGDNRYLDNGCGRLDSRSFTWARKYEGPKLKDKIRYSNQQPSQGYNQQPHNNQGSDYRTLPREPRVCVQQNTSIQSSGAVTIFGQKWDIATQGSNSANGCNYYRIALPLWMRYNIYNPLY